MNSHLDPALREEMMLVTFRAAIASGFASSLVIVMVKLSSGPGFVPSAKCKSGKTNSSVAVCQPKLALKVCLRMRPLLSDSVTLYSPFNKSRSPKMESEAGEVLVEASE